MSNTAPHAPAPVAQSSPAPATESSAFSADDHYESAKGCFMLSLFIVGALAVCAVVGYAIHAYIEYSVG
ncbi:MAG: hypothetical protein ACF8MJ_01575 [Phycisphaerales bacterium JB050]